VEPNDSFFALVPQKQTYTLDIIRALLVPAPEFDGMRKVTDDSQQQIAGIVEWAKRIGETSNAMEWTLAGHIVRC